MARKIFKYQLQGIEDEGIQMPKDAKILAVQMQGAAITLWAEVDEDNLMETRTFSIVGTGWTLKGLERKYIGTVQHNGLVWHIYEQSL